VQQQKRQTDSSWLWCTPL